MTTMIYDDDDVFLSCDEARRGVRRAGMYYIVV